MIRDDDIIRALGFVTLYAGNFEDSVEKVMEQLAQVKEITDKERKWPTSRKIKWCIEVLQSLENDELNDRIKLNERIDLLRKTRNFLEKRNEIIHGRIYAESDETVVLKSSRPRVPKREITADELYDLAEELFDLQAELPWKGSFATDNAIARNNNSKK